MKIISAIITLCLVIFFFVTLFKGKDFWEKQNTVTNESGILIMDILISFITYTPWYIRKIVLLLFNLMAIAIFGSATVMLD